MHDNMRINVETTRARAHWCVYVLSTPDNPIYLRHGYLSVCKCRPVFVCQCQTIKPTKRLSGVQKDMPVTSLLHEHHHSDVGNLVTHLKGRRDVPGLTFCLLWSESDSGSFITAIRCVRGGFCNAATRGSHLGNLFYKTQTDYKT
jgi:hypothetical protein